MTQRGSNRQQERSVALTLSNSAKGEVEIKEEQERRTTSNNRSEEARHGQEEMPPRQPKFGI